MYSLSILVVLYMCFFGLCVLCRGCNESSALRMAFREIYVTGAAAHAAWHSRSASLSETKIIAEKNHLTYITSDRQICVTEL